ncbi:MAG: DUF4405 domain-containing protein [Syntrophobacteraceae bacterium]
MKTTARKLFNLRGFVILTATVTGLGLPITGLENHLHQMEPIISRSRHAWMAAHSILGVLFMVATVSHAIPNRRILLNYVRGHAARPGIGREAIGAVVLVAVMLFVVVGHAFH